MLYERRKRMLPGAIPKNKAAACKAICFMQLLCFDLLRQGRGSFLLRRKYHQRYFRSINKVYFF